MLQKENENSLEKLQKENEDLRKENEERLEELRKKIEDHRKDNENQFEELKKRIEDLEKDFKRYIIFKENNSTNEILNDLKEVELNEKLINDEEKKCAICLENYSIGNKIIYLPCCHYFHSSCIKDWIRIKNKCPYCNNII